MAFKNILNRLRTARSSGTAASTKFGMLSKVRMTPPTSDSNVVPQMGDDRVQKFQSRFGRNSYLQRRSIIG